MAQTPLILGRSSRDGERFERGLGTWPQTVKRRIRDSPATFAIFPVRHGNVQEGRFERIRHALGRPMRDAEFVSDLVEAHAAPPGCGHVRKTQKVMGLRI